MMTICIELLQQQHPAENPAYEDILYAIGTLAGCTSLTDYSNVVLDTYFHVYVGTLMPFIYAALEAQDQPQLLSASLGLLSDVIRAVGEQIAPHCDQIVRYLFTDVESNTVSRMVKPSILAVFGEIALVIGAAFEPYLPVVMQLLQQAATLGSGTRDQTGFEMLDYIDSLNEGILEAYSGIILGLKGAGKGTLLIVFIKVASSLIPYMQMLFGFLALLHSDPDKSEDTLKSMVGIIGYSNSFTFLISVMSPKHSQAVN
jgi:importin subunit beta-1